MHVRFTDLARSSNMIYYYITQKIKIYLFFHLQRHYVQNVYSIFRYDWIQFYDGNDQSGPVLGCGRKWCGNTHPDITSTGNRLFIKFHSDTSLGTSGFNISYVAGKFYPQNFDVLLHIQK